MSPGQDSVDRYLAEHETPIDRTIRLIREDERAKMLADLRAKVLALPYVLTYGTAEVKRDDVLALFDGGSE